MTWAGLEVRTQKTALPTQTKGTSAVTREEPPGSEPSSFGPAQLWGGGTDAQGRPAWEQESLAPSCNCHTGTLPLLTHQEGSR